jgi:1,2-phenylacetyl-CoA epoxidase PaaB subunit
MIKMNGRPLVTFRHGYLTAVLTALYLSVVVVVHARLVPSNQNAFPSGLQAHHSASFLPLPHESYESNKSQDDGLIRIKKNLPTQRSERREVRETPIEKKKDKDALEVKSTTKSETTSVAPNSTVADSDSKDRQTNSSETTVILPEDIKELKALDKLISLNETQQLFARHNGSTTLSPEMSAKMQDIENDVRSHNATDIWADEADVTVSKGSDKPSKKTNSSRRQEESDSQNKKRMDTFYMSLMAWICVAGFGLLVGLLVGLLIFGSE